MATEHLSEMLKHLPPSGVSLRLVDVSSSSMLQDIQQLRPDVEPIASLDTLADLADNSVDAVIGFHPDIEGHALPDFLTTVRHVLRPGGRLIIVESSTVSLDARARLFEQAGYARILTEVLDDRLLSRGEKPHVEGSSTSERIAVGIGADTFQSATRIWESADLHGAPGRYLHLLIKQTPNKPAWALGPDDVLEWEAVALPATSDAPYTLLAFSSLPQAVAFMQQAIMQGAIRDVSKIAKFSHATGSTWSWPVWLNPTLDLVLDSKRLPLKLVAIDPSLAEAPDE